MAPDNGKVGIVSDGVRELPKALLLTIDEVAGLIGVTSRKTWSLVSSGRIDSRKLDGRRLVPFEAVKAFVDTLENDITVIHKLIGRCPNCGVLSTTEHPADETHSGPNDNADELVAA